MGWQEDVEAYAKGDALDKAKDMADKAIKAYRPTGDAAYNQRKEIKSMPWFFDAGIPEIGWPSKERPIGLSIPSKAQAMVSAGRETSKLLGGIADTYNVASAMLGLPGDAIKSALGMSEDMMSSPDHIKAIANREIENRKERQLMKPYENYSSFLPDFLGRSMPYMLDSVLVGPLTAKLGRGIADLAEAGVESAKSEGRGLLQAVANKLTSSGSEIAQATGKKMRNEIILPMVKAKRAAVNRAKSGAEDIVRDPMYAGMRDAFLGNTILGAVEGGLHQDSTMVEGAMNSAIGSAIGAKLKPALTHLPDYYRPMERQVMDWASDKGYKWLPGMESGSGRLQMFERGIKNSRTLGDVARRSDQFNDQITNSVVSKAMGIKDVKSDLSPDVLRNHLTSLSDEYEKLAKDISINISPKDKDKVINHFKALSNDPSEQVQEGIKLGKHYYDWINKLTLPQRDPFTGALKKAPTDGQHYQEVRRSLKSTIDDAWTKGDGIKAKTLTPVLDMLDHGTTRGMLKSGSKSDVKALKDLNERNAMTNMVLEHGFDPLHGADLVKLGNHFLASDPKRYATQLHSGRRLKDLQNASKLELLRARQAGGVATGLGITHDFGSKLRGNTNQTILQSFMQTPAAELISPLLSGYMKAYEAGVPALTGYLGAVPLPGLYKQGLSGTNFGDTMKIGRSLSQNETIESKFANLAADKNGRLMPLSPLHQLDTLSLQKILDGTVKIK